MQIWFEYLFSCKNSYLFILFRTEISNHIFFYFVCIAYVRIISFRNMIKQRKIEYNKNRNLVCRSDRQKRKRFEMFSIFWKEMRNVKRKIRANKQISIQMADFNDHIIDCSYIKAVNNFCEKNVPISKVGYCQIFNMQQLIIDIQIN